MFYVTIFPAGYITPLLHKPKKYANIYINTKNIAYTGIQQSMQPQQHLCLVPSQARQINVGNININTQKQHTPNGRYLDALLTYSLNSLFS